MGHCYVHFAFLFTLMKYCNRINSGASGALQWAGGHRDYDFTGGEFRSSDVTIGDRRFEVVEIIKGGKYIFYRN